MKIICFMYASFDGKICKNAVYSALKNGVRLIACPLQN